MGGERAYRPSSRTTRMMTPRRSRTGSGLSASNRGGPMRSLRRAPIMAGMLQSRLQIMAGMLQSRLPIMAGMLQSRTSGGTLIQGSRSAQWRQHGCPRLQESAAPGANLARWTIRDLRSTRPCRSRSRAVATEWTSTACNMRPTTRLRPLPAHARCGVSSIRARRVRLRPWQRARRQWVGHVGSRSHLAAPRLVVRRPRLAPLQFSRRFNLGPLRFNLRASHRLLVRRRLAGRRPCSRHAPHRRGVPPNPCRSARRRRTPRRVPA